MVHVDKPHEIVVERADERVWLGSSLVLEPNHAGPDSGDDGRVDHRILGLLDGGKKVVVRDENGHDDAERVLEGWATS